MLLGRHAGRWLKPLVFSLFLVLVSTFAFPQFARAQGLGADTLGSLIEGLRNIQEQGGLQDFFGTLPGDLLDQTRRRAAQSVEERRQGQDQTRAAFTSAELFLISEFCEGRIGEEAERVLRLVTNFSQLERDYCLRAQQVLVQFGYDMFDAAVDPDILRSGAIQDSYRLGIGDELVITFSGQQSKTSAVLVDREGRVLLNNLPPVVAAGRTFGDFRAALEAVTASSFIGTEVFVSLGAVRQISVLVLGEVRTPGFQQLTSLSSVVDALGLARGIKKTGSLRKVQVRRGEDIFRIDFYSLLFGTGASRDLILAEGDQVLVPPIGSTIAIGGDVKRPGIYELEEGQETVSAVEAIAFAGGELRPRGNRFDQITFDDDGREFVTSATDLDFAVRDGDIVIVGRRENIQLGAVELVGHVRVPGRRALQSAPTMSALLRDANALADDPYLLFAILETTDPSTQSRRLFPINAEAILRGEQDFSLRDRDRLIILSQEDVRYLSSADVQNIIISSFEEETREQGRLELASLDLGDGASSTTVQAIQGVLEQLGVASAGPAGEAQAAPALAQPQLGVAGGLLFSRCQSLQVLSKLVSDVRVGRFSNAVQATDQRRVRVAPAQPCRSIYEDHIDLLPFILEHVTAINGEVRKPGIYPVANETPLRSLISVSGGFTREADLTRVEISRFTPDPARGTASISRNLVDLAEDGAEAILLRPGDVVRLNAVFTDRDTGPIVLGGEFVRPGTYDIRRGERLSQVIARAGGLTEQAYPFGAIFTREAVKRAEKVALQRLARELNAAVTVAAANQGIDPSAVAAFAQLTREVASAPAVGRMVMEADPTVLGVRPELDLVLEPGDRLFMPKRPNSVLVTGDVLNPGAMQFISGTKVDKYIRQAGGFQQSADDGRIFLVLPNGVAQPISVSAFNFTPIQVPPGSTIVVPKDVTPFDLLTFTKEIATVLSQLAITAASLAVIGNN
ncbi:MAG: SLBB domain-containing protein [Proteobacteria bacterium]|nr:SLBB domain-containing protein [Pseudomonadota bacterium]